MSRTNIDLGDRAVRVVMERYDLRSKRDAVNYALQRLAAEAMTTREALAMRGSGWEGDLAALRESRTATEPGRLRSWRQPSVTRSRHPPRSCSTWTAR